MKNTIIIKMAAVLALGWTVACQSNTTASNNTAANQKPANSTVANTTQAENKIVANVAANTDKPAKTATEEPTKTSGGSLATPTEAYKTAYAARKNKDIPGLKRAMSKDALEFLSIVAEDKSVEDMLKELTETPQAATDESRNEKITGDTATLEYLDAQGKWKTMDFVKETTEWKITFPKGDGAGNSNTPKKK